MDAPKTAAPAKQTKIVGPYVEPHPMRKVVTGFSHTIPELKAYVASADLHAGIKAFLEDELDALPTNGRGFDLHISLAPMVLGAGAAVNAAVLDLHDVLKSPRRKAGTQLTAPQQ